MNQLVNITFNEEHGYVVSSRVIAEQLNKQHKHVLESLRNILNNSSADISAQLIESSYKDTSGKTNREYLLTKDGFILYMFNIQGFNDFKMAYINRFNELEKQQKALQIPADYPSALRALAESYEKEQEYKLELKAKSEVIETMQPKVTYYDYVLQCKDLMTTTSIAKDYGMSATRLNRMLCEDGVQYFQSGRYYLYAKYADKGYAGSKTVAFPHYGSTQTKSSMAWTQKGRLFIYDHLKQNGILPIVERDTL